MIDDPLPNQPGPAETMALAEREVQYSPSSMIGGDISGVLAHYAAASAATRATYPPTVHSYGTGAEEVLDLFAPSSVDNEAAVLHIYLHGGYWQQLSRHESSFHIAPLLDDGHWVAVPEYTLAPLASLGEIVDQCQRAVRWCVEQIERGRIPVRYVILSGCSAGAHLAAMVLTEEAGVDAAVLLSGVYDLEPLVGTSINDAVGLTHHTARALSPLSLAPARPVPIVVADGVIETAEFHRQSDDLAIAWGNRGCPTVRITVPGRNHFDLPEDVGRADTELGRAVSQLCPPGTPGRLKG